MKQVKLEVAGYQTVYTDGDLSYFSIEKIDSELIEDLYESHEITIHPNGKPKFRPVYRKAP